LKDKFLNPTGQLYTCNVSGLSKISMKADRLLITRAGFDVPNVEIIRDLSPSPELFQTYLTQWKDKVSPDIWWSDYENRFTHELQLESRIKALRDVYKRLIQGRNVILLCFCKDHRYCHRRLVGNFFNEFGAEAHELNPVVIEQMQFF